MLKPPHRTLCFLLRAFSLLAVLGGLFMVFADRQIMVRILLRPQEGQVSTLLLSLLKEMGGLALMLAVLLWLAARDPVRNVAIVDGRNCRAVHSRHDTSRIAVDDRHSQSVPCVLDLGTIRGAASHCRPALLAATTRGSVGTCWEFLTDRLARRGGRGRADTVALRSAQDRGNGENSGCRPHPAASKQHSPEGGREQRHDVMKKGRQVPKV